MNSPGQKIAGTAMMVVFAVIIAWFIDSARRWQMGRRE